MKTIRIGIICPSEIAFRRFLPSLKQVEGIEYAGVAVANEAEWNGTLTDAMKQGELLLPRPLQSSGSAAGKT